ncbi:molybdopterin synthase catalytic subunit MoaE [Thalassotalea euphylliae]|uniref:molybdopterin synthase catalytic subunit MoaE n=1 Tax=Thalassotalea euphylliae TaxID=1655234 RepID=UPI00364407CA
MIRVSDADFSFAEEMEKLERENINDGAIVTFTGRVRARNDGHDVTGLFLEHYPAMTQVALHNIVEQAKRSWDINRVTVIHRVGQLQLGDNIVFVGVTSPHRGDAFAAGEFIMDFLKVNAPFWKKETRTSGDAWVEAKQSDEDKAKGW